VWPLLPVRLQLPRIYYCTQMLALNLLSSGFQAPVTAPIAASGAAVSAKMAAMEDLQADAAKLNPVVGYFDPLNLAQLNFWGTGDEGTIGFLRHAEIKHGRVAMAGFVGYIVHENGIHWPWALSTSLPDYSSFAGLSAPAVWDALPLASKLQIVGVIGILEAWSETKYVLENDGQAHYMKGGTAGYYPTFDLGSPKEGSMLGWGIPHPCPFNLYDPLNFSKNRSEEDKARGLIVEINNGRLAMLGLMGFISEAKLEGSVPALTGLVKSYGGNVMAPFEVTL